jgi:hypothetical protein
MNIFQRSASSKLRPAVKPTRRDMIFVFGSNEAGIHGAGAARAALLQHGAVWGVGFGHEGDSFAIPTKDQFIKTLPILTINHYVENFIRYARANSHLRFQVTQLGCGLAGLKPEHIAPMFMKAPENCSFDLAWRPHLPERKGEDYRYWGTFP